jgi:hypothetical protein
MMEQHGKSEKYMLLLLKNEDITSQYSGGEMFAGQPLNDIL